MPLAINKCRKYMPKESLASDQEFMRQTVPKPASLTTDMNTETCLFIHARLSSFPNELTLRSVPMVTGTFNTG